ncbi:MAG: hypothetical protein JNM27_02265 [Leptospirales bacterium]|nr:hypothetical protein [Leptospirales bacterium]
MGSRPQKLPALEKIETNAPVRHRYNVEGSQGFAFGIFDDGFELRGWLEPVGAGRFRFEKSVAVGRNLVGPRALVHVDGRVLIDSALPPLTVGDDVLGFGIGRESGGLWITVRIAQIARHYHGILIEAESSHLTAR